MHALVGTALPDPVDTVALDVSIGEIRIIAMSKEVEAELYGLGFGTETDLRSLLLDIVGRARPVPSGDPETGIGATFESTASPAGGGGAALPARELIIEQFGFNPAVARMYHRRVRRSSTAS
jgi:hypothetical protein